MTTTRQIEANRINSKLGGVKTDQGKEIVKYNARKHGLLSKEVLMPEEDSRQLEKLVADYYSQLNPVTTLECLLVDKIIAANWRLRRAYKIESATMKIESKRKYEESKSWSGLTDAEWMNDDDSRMQGIEAMIDNDKIEKLTRYITTIERSLYRALHELERVQMRRAGLFTPPAISLDVLGL